MFDVAFVCLNQKLYSMYKLPEISSHYWDILSRFHVFSITSIVDAFRRDLEQEEAIPTFHNKEHECICDSWSE